MGWLHAFSNADTDQISVQSAGNGVNRFGRVDSNRLEGHQTAEWLLSSLKWEIPSYKETGYKHPKSVRKGYSTMQKTSYVFAVLLTTVIFAGVASAQKMPMKGMQPCAASKMPMMDMGKVPDPDLLITTFEKQVVVPDEALLFAPTGMGKKFFAKLIAKVDFGNNIFFDLVRGTGVPAAS